MARQMDYFLGIKGGEAKRRRQDAALQWKRNVCAAPRGIPLVISSMDFGARDQVATFQGVDDIGAPIWLVETEDGPMRVSRVQAWRYPKGVQPQQEPRYQ